MFTLLSQVVQDRLRELGEQHIDNLKALNAKPPTTIQPAILVLIDNFAELRENHELLLEEVVTPLLRRCLNAGVTFVITANVRTEFPSKLYNQLGERLTFEQTDPERYLDILGRRVPALDNCPGRGYVRIEGRPLLFQAALPVGLFTKQEGRADAADFQNEAAELQLLVNNMQSKGGWLQAPVRIGILPKLIPLRKLLPQAEVEGNRPLRIRAILGKDGNLQPAYFDLKRTGPHFALKGQSLSGKTTALHNWVISLCYGYAPAQVQLILIDLQARFFDYRGQTSLANLPHVLAAIKEVEELPALITRLEIEGKQMEEQATNRAIFILIDNFDELVDELSNPKDANLRDVSRNLMRIARRYGRHGIHFVIAGALTASSELKNAIFAARYGVELRSGDGLTSLVRPKPGRWRDKGLPVGRGFLAKSGEVALIQIATPYQEQETMLIDNNADENDRMITGALDQWVQEIQARWQRQPKALWSTGSASNQTTQVEQLPESDQVRKIKVLVNKAIEKGNSIVVANWLALNVVDQNNEVELIAWLKTTMIDVLHAKGQANPEKMLDFCKTTESLIQIAQTHLR